MPTIGRIGRIMQNITHRVLKPPHQALQRDPLPCQAAEKLRMVDHCRAQGDECSGEVRVPRSLVELFAFELRN
jgi:hypothetical protein